MYGMTDALSRQVFSKLSQGKQGPRSNLMIVCRYEDEKKKSYKPLDRPIGIYAPEVCLSNSPHISATNAAIGFFRYKKRTPIQETKVAVQIQWSIVDWHDVWTIVSSLYA